jgi:hypothetical protein
MWHSLMFWTKIPIAPFEPLAVKKMVANIHINLCQQRYETDVSLGLPNDKWTDK